MFTQKLGRNSGPLFQVIAGHHVLYFFVAKQQCSAISFIDLDLKVILYKGHSFGIGAGTHAARMGYSKSLWGDGGWNLDAKVHKTGQLSLLNFLLCSSFAED